MTLRIDITASTLALTLIALLLSACGGGGGDGGSPPAVNTPITNTPDPSDRTPPSIVSQSPAPNAQRVPLDATVSVGFNEPMHVYSISSVTFEIIEPVFQTPLQGGVRYDAATRTASFSHMTPFREFSTYKVVLDGMTDEMVNPLPYTEWQFTTADVTAPATTAAPLGGYYNSPQAVSLACADLNGSGCATTYYSLDGSTPNLVYTGPVAITATNTPVTLRFFSVDAHGNAEAVRSQVYVIDTIRPEVVATSPRTGASGAVLTDIVSADFSEPVLPASVNTASFTVSAANHIVVGSVSLSDDHRQARFTPNERLECNTLYTARLTTGVTDRAGNALLAAHSWTFTSHGDCTEPKTSVSPNGGVFRLASQTATLSCTDSGSGCRRLVYTTDGSVPSFAPLNGTVVNGATTGVSLSVGDTELRFASEDFAGNKEPVKFARFSLSTTGFTYVATETGLARGVGPVPVRFVNTVAMRADNMRAGKIFVDNTNARIYLVGNGVYASDDGGANWNLIFERLGDSSADALYARGSRIYAGGFRGLFVSSDGGLSFRQTTLRDSVYAIYEVDKTLFIGTSGGFWRSRDRGNTFERASTYRVNALAGDGAARIYAAVEMGGVLVSADGGNTFSAPRTTSDGLGSNAVADLFLTPAGTLYAATANGLSISTDNGNTFTNRTTGLPTLNLRSVAATDAGAVYVSGYYATYEPTRTAIAISNNGGTSFTQTATMYQGLAGAAVADLSIIGTRLFAFTEGGLSISENGGTSFSAVGLSDSRVGDIDMDTAGKIYVAAGNGYQGVGGLSVSTDGGHTFTTMNLRHGLPNPALRSVEVSANGASVHTASEYLAGGIAAGYARSLDGGLSFTRPATAPSWSGPLAIDGLHVYSAGDNNAFMASHDNGASFAPGPAAASRPADIVVAPTGRVYVATEYGIAVSNDNGASFPTVLTRANGLGANRVGAMHHNATTLYARVMGSSSDAGSVSGISLSTDGGASFSTLISGQHLPYGDIFSIDTYSGYLYVGMTTGLAISSDGGATFTTRSADDGVGGVRRVYYRP